MYTRWRLIDDVITKKAQLSNDIVCRGIFYSFLVNVASGVARGGGGRGGRPANRPRNHFFKTLKSG